MLQVPALGKLQLDNLVFNLEREDFRIAITHKEASQFTEFKETKGLDKIKALVAILKKLKQQVTYTNLQRETEDMLHEILSNIEDKMIEEISRQIETMSLKQIQIDEEYC